MKLTIRRRSGLPVFLNSSEVEALANLPINEAIEYERSLRKSGRDTVVNQTVSGLYALCEVLDQLSRYNPIQSRMNGVNDMTVEIQDVEVRS